MFSSNDVCLQPQGEGYMLAFFCLPDMDCCLLDGSLSFANRYQSDIKWGFLYFGGRQITGIHTREAQK